MVRRNKEEYKYIEYFNPDVMPLKQAHQDFEIQMKRFNAGNGYENFNEFISDDALEYADVGDGATYVVWNILYCSCSQSII